MRRLKQTPSWSLGRREAKRNLLLIPMGHAGPSYKSCSACLTMTTTFREELLLSPFYTLGNRNIARQSKFAREYTNPTAKALPAPQLNAAQVPWMQARLVVLRAGSSPWAIGCCSCTRSLIQLFCTMFSIFCTSHWLWDWCCLSCVVRCGAMGISGDDP